MREARFNDPTKVGKRLSPREVEIIKLRTSGMTGAQIGTALGISEQTVKNHLWRAYDKLGVARCSNPEARACYLYGVAKASESFRKILDTQRQRDALLSSSFRPDMV